MTKALLASSLFVIGLCGPILADDVPRIIPRSAQISHPIDQVFGTYKHYFNDSSLSQFRLTSADEKSETLIAVQSGLDAATWGNWAFCEAPTQQMIYKFSDGAVTVAVHLEKTGKETTYATISADFQATYTLANQESKIACTSKGGLEQALLEVAGAPAKSQ